MREGMAPEGKNVSRMADRLCDRDGIPPVLCRGAGRENSLPPFVGRQVFCHKKAGGTDRIPYPCMQVRLFHVCYTLVEAETLEQRWKLYREGGRPLKFLTYREALRYQKERDLYKDYTVELYAFREKEIRLAA